MTATVVARSPAAIEPRIPTWQLAAASFLPQDRRVAARRWIARAPLTLVLAVQVGLTTRLSNTAYRDEALYIWTGHRMFQHWWHGAVLYDNPSRYFSGSPAVYPPLAAMIDRLGGLTAVRAFSLVCMLVATLALHSFTRRLFGRRSATVAALAFVLAGSTQQLGHFATFDPPALMLLASACAIGVRAAQRRALGWAPLVGVLLAAAVAVKYAAVLFVPFVVVVIACSTARGLPSPAALLPARRPRPTRHPSPHTEPATIGEADHGQRSVRSTLSSPAVRVAALAAAVTIGLLVVLAATVARADFAGFKATTLGRAGASLVLPATPWQVVGKALGFAGPWYALVVLGAVSVVVHQRRAVLPLALVAAAIAPVASQARIGEAVSLEKHIDFGLLFGAVLIGALARAGAAAWARLGLIASFVLLAIFGAATSARIFQQWSNTSALTHVLAYKFQAAPYIRTLGEPYEPIRYAFEDRTRYWQWNTTDPITALFYKPAHGKPLRGIAAAKAGLADDYWQVVYFDSATGPSQELERLLPHYGYRLTDTVKLTNRAHRDVYHIWQRFK